MNEIILTHIFTQSSVFGHAPSIAKAHAGRAATLCSVLARQIRCTAKRCGPRRFARFAASVAPRTNALLRQLRALIAIRDARADFGAKVARGQERWQVFRYAMKHGPVLARGVDQIAQRVVAARIEHRNVIVVGQLIVLRTASNAIINACVSASIACHRTQRLVHLFSRLVARPTRHIANCDPIVLLSCASTDVRSNVAHLGERRVERKKAVVELIQELRHCCHTTLFFLFQTIVL